MAFFGGCVSMSALYRAFADHKTQKISNLYLLIKCLCAFDSSEIYRMKLDCCLLLRKWESEKYEFIVFLLSLYVIRYRYNPRKQTIFGLSCLACVRAHSQFKQKWINNDAIMTMKRINLIAIDFKSTIFPKSKTTSMPFNEPMEEKVYIRENLFLNVPIRKPSTTNKPKKRETHTKKREYLNACTVWDIPEILTAY